MKKADEEEIIITISIIIITRNTIFTLTREARVKGKNTESRKSEGGEDVDCEKDFIQEQRREINQL